MLQPFAAHRWTRSLATLLGALLAALALLLYGDVRPAFADVSVGSSAGGFLSFEVGGRSAGMAGAQVATATGVTAQFWNPAGLSRTDQAQVGVMHATWLGNLSYEWLGYARPLGSRLGVASLSMAYFHMPSIQGVDAFDNPTESFRVYDLAVTAGLARPLSRHVSLGANARLIRQNLATVSATGASVDLGTTATFGGTSIAAVVQNLGPNLSYDASSYPLPRQIRFGASRQFLEQKLLVAADYNIPSDYYKDVRVGTEFQVHPMLALRMGYRKELGSTDDPATGLSYGVGLRLKQLTMDYAMTPSDGFDNVHRVALGYSFGSGAEESAKKPAPPKKEKPLPPPPPKEPTTIASAEKATKVADKAAAEAPVVAKAPAKAAEKAAPAPKVVASAKSTPQAAVKESKPAPTVTEFAVLLPGYQSKSSAQAEIKALQLLGFRTKDATIVATAGGGYAIRLAQMKSKSSAADMVSDLSRMSFRAEVQTVQR